MTTLPDNAFAVSRVRASGAALIGCPKDAGKDNDAAIALAPMSTASSAGKAAILVAAVGAWAISVTNMAMFSIDPIDRIPTGT